MRDKCQMCEGKSGGVPGNENVINGYVVCDYCTVKYADYLRDMPAIDVVLRKTEGILSVEEQALVLLWMVRYYKLKED